TSSIRWRSIWGVTTTSSSREDLRVANLVWTRQLAKSLADAGWAQLRTLLEYQGAGAGKQVVVLAPAVTRQSPGRHPAVTTQDCSACGARVEKSLSVRTHLCPSCGFIADRALNAALTIYRAGQARGGAGAVVPAVQRASVGL